MKAVRKRPSKRVLLKNKYKVEMKKREHNKKVRKLAKQNPIATKLKKDPGIPNLFPFKEQLLQKIQAYKEKAKQEKLQAKEERKKEKAEVKGKSESQKLSDLASSAKLRGQEYEVSETTRSSEGDTYGKNVGLELDKSRKAYYKEFKKVVEASDVILEVLDARDPNGCRCPDIEAMIREKYPEKRIVLVLNKIDLVPKDVAEEWRVHLRNIFPTILFKCSTQQQKTRKGQSKVDINEASRGQLQTSECVGAEQLVQLLKNYARSKNIKTSVIVGIIGYPNVGKSSLINSLKRQRAVGVGASPGFTKHIQEVHLDKHVKLLDSPGIVFDHKKSGAVNENVILRNAVKVSNILDPIAPVEALLARCQPEKIKSIFQIDTKFESTTRFLTAVALKRGLLKKGGIPNIDSAARLVLNEWNSGTIPYYTLPPKDDTTTLKHKVHLSAEIVSEFGKEIDLGQQEVLKKLVSNPQNDDMIGLVAGGFGEVDKNLLVDNDNDDEDNEEDEDMGTTTTTTRTAQHDEQDDEEIDDESDSDDYDFSEHFKTKKGTKNSFKDLNEEDDSEEEKEEKEEEKEEEEEGNDEEIGEEGDDIDEDDE